MLCSRGFGYGHLFGKEDLDLATAAICEDPWIGSSEMVRIDSSVQPFVSEMPDRGCPTEFEV